MESIFRNVSKWIKLFAKIGFIVLAAYGFIMMVREFVWDEFLQGLLDFTMYSFKAFVFMFVTYGFGVIVENAEAKANANRPAPAPKPQAPAPAPAQAPAFQQAPAYQQAPSFQQAPAPAPASAPAPSVKVCPNCGRENAPESRFWEKCGTPL